MAFSTPVDLVSTFDTANAASTTTASVTLTNGRLYLMFTGLQRTGGAPSLSGGGWTVLHGAVDRTADWDFIGQTLPYRTGDLCRLYALYYVATSTQTVTITWNPDGNSSSHNAIAIMEIASGFDPSNPIAQSAFNEATTTATSLTVALAVAPTAGNLSVAAFKPSTTTTGGPIERTNWTELSEDAGTGTGADAGFLQTQYKTALNAEQSASASVAATNRVWGGVHLEIQAAATNRTLTADAGSYTETGTAAALKVGRLLTAASGTYTETGTAATLRRNVPITAASGTHTLTGTAATLTQTSVLDAASGTYAMTGTAATLKMGHLLALASGSYTLTGQDATLEYETPNRTLAANSGAFVLTGTAATPTVGHVLSAQAGGYAETGTAVSLLYGRTVGAASGTYAETGTAAALLYGRTLGAGSGSYAETGTAATALYGRLLAAGVGVYVLTGTDADLIADLIGVTLVADGGAYAYAGTAATLTRGAAPPRYQTIRTLGDLADLLLRDGRRRRRPRW